MHATEPKYFTVTNNVSRETFNFVKANPGCTRQQLIKELTGRGFKESSVSSMIAQMIKKGMVRGDSMNMHAVAKEYRPLKSGAGMKKLREEAARAKKPVKVVKPVKATLEEKKAAIPVVATPTKQWTAEEVLNGLSVLQARAVYNELKKLFGNT